MKSDQRLIVEFSDGSRVDEYRIRNREVEFRARCRDGSTLPDSGSEWRQLATDDISLILRCTPSLVNGQCCDCSVTARRASEDAKEETMIQFACDTCGKIKKATDIWILGLAAENVGVVSLRREVDILSGWSGAQAVHPLAVHFCSEECKHEYVSKMFVEKAS